MARSASSPSGGCPSPCLGPAFLRPSCCRPPGEGGPGSSGASPASSPDSRGPSPAYRAWRAGGGPGGRKGGRARLGGGQRQSASQREKLRMRHLAQALLALRRYLPASVAPAGQSLTKIETLRLAIRYIAHLSELLGLSEESLARRPCALGLPDPACCPPPPPRLPEPEAEPWRAAATCCGQGDRAGAAPLPAGLAGATAAHPCPPSQSLPDELLTFLEDFFPLAAPGRD
ncbi:uncharacterized protein PHA67_004337 [Liasis olivaceus]